MLVNVYLHHQEKKSVGKIIVHIKKKIEFQSILTDIFQFV